MTQEKFAFGRPQSRLNVIEIDALYRLLDLQLPRGASGWIDAIPVEYAVSRVAILLDFDQQIACAYRMKTAGWQENSIARLNGNPMNVINDTAIA